MINFETNTEVQNKAVGLSLTFIQQKAKLIIILNLALQILATTLEN